MTCSAWVFLIAGGMALNFTVFGRVEVSSGGGVLVLTGSKVGQLVSLLLARSNETLGTEAVIDELWGERPPRSALTTLQTYVYLARKQMASQLGIRDPDQVLVTRSRGYAMRVEEGALDIIVFERLVAEGADLLAAGDAKRAAAQLARALRVARGSAFAGIPTGALLEARVTYLNELRLTATGLHIEAHQQLGHSRELIPQLRTLVSENPFHEGFHGQLIRTLHQCGRRAEALQAYASLRRILAEQLGVGPCEEIQQLHRSILA